MIARVEKSSHENQPKARRSEKEGTARGDTESIARSEEAYTPKSPNRFANTSTRKSGIELLQSQDWTRVEGRGLPDTTGAEKRRLSEPPGIEKQGLSGSLEPKALSTVIKIRFTEPMSIIK